jgi:hypothetical protein
MMIMERGRERNEEEGESQNVHSDWKVHVLRSGKVLEKLNSNLTPRIINLPVAQYSTR